MLSLLRTHTVHLETLVLGQTTSPNIETTLNATVVPCIPETFTVPGEILRDIHKEGSGPGNFAARLTQRLFQKLYGSSNV
ncbi:hypothetical protein DPMN_051224 [Dreissena polymorpha]|uniref:Uncharacterized protein n=1 Tax=Dreissena polymorpha TaxID=45954 RepID=A0A9D4CJK9_DREPO|nr:hypothetical protein DPMN_051224 [Dreissena polymorpha]